MIFSHISDTHLGFTQYGAEEREQDVYDVFNEAINTSIKDHVDFVIFAGDIFHSPKPSGTAILQMANALKRLKQNSIDSFFVLGDHDISRMTATPIPYVYHNLGFSRYIGGEEDPVEYKGVLLCGFDNMRGGAIKEFEEKSKKANSFAKTHQGHKILVMHQGIKEFHERAGQLLSTDLPPDFTYYAMGHLHDHDIREFSHLGGPVAYPGSTEVTSTEGVKETKKGFIEVDISSPEAKTSWIELNARPQYSYEVSYPDLASTMEKIASQIEKLERKPVVEIKIGGDEIETERIQAEVSRIDDMSLRCFWRVASREQDVSVPLGRPSNIEDELLRLSVKATGSERIAGFAINELLPLLSSKQVGEASQAIMENFEKFKAERK